MSPLVRSLCLAVLALVPGACALIRDAAPPPASTSTVASPAASPSAAAAETAIAVAPAAVAPAPAPAAAPPAPAEERAARPAKPVAPAPKPSAAPAKPSAPSKPARAPEAVAAAKPSPAKPAPQAAAAPAAAAPQPAAAPALDLKSLEQKLKDTEAIGLMTKLSIKNQVDDLVQQFRAYHDGRRPPTLPDLRRPYEMLLMKLLALLQDRDPPLASELARSREAIWVVLTDREKFSQTAT